MTRAVVRGLLTAALAVSPAAALTAHLLTHPPLQFATPRPDGRIGTPDGVVVTGATMLGPQDSGQNTHSAASFAYLIGSGLARGVHLVGQRDVPLAVERG